MATAQNATPRNSFSGASLSPSFDVEPTTVIITPRATRTRPRASVAVGTFFSTSTAHAAHTTGMDARMTWLKLRLRCRSDALFRAMFTAMKAPMATRPRHERMSVSAWFEEDPPRVATSGARASVWNRRCAHVSVTGNRNPAWPSV